MGTSMSYLAMIVLFLFNAPIFEPPLNSDGVAILGAHKVRYRLELLDFEKTPQWDDFDKSPPLTGKSRSNWGKGTQSFYRRRNARTIGTGILLGSEQDLIGQ